MKYVLARQWVAILGTLRKRFTPSRVMTEEIYLSIRVIPNTNAIAALFPAGQSSAPFDFAHGVPSNALRVFGSIIVINAIHNTHENCHSYTGSPIRLKIASVSTEVQRACFEVVFFVEIRPNYLSIAIVTFRIALIQQSYHGVSPLH
jgi:hypothetical protein